MHGYPRDAAMTISYSLRRTLVDVIAPLAALFLVSRGVLLLIASVTLDQLPSGSGRTDGSLLSHLCRFDCSWYLDVARHGYSINEDPNHPGATNFAFYPLFPWAIRLLTPWFRGDYLLTAVTLTNVCFVTAMWFVYRYARVVGLEHRPALLSTALLCVLPQSIAFSAAYSESPFLLLAVLAMYFSRTEKYLLSGLAAALLSATRANGLFFTVYALVLIWQQHGFRNLVSPWRQPQLFVPLMLAPLGFFLFLTCCFALTGDAFAHPSTEQYGWGWYFATPWTNLQVRLSSSGISSIAAWASMGVAACSLLLLRDRLYADFAWCGALIILIWSGTGAESIFRYWLVLFPIWIALARALADRPVACSMTFAAAALVNGAMMCAWILQNQVAI